MAKNNNRNRQAPKPIEKPEAKPADDNKIEVSDDAQISISENVDEPAEVKIEGEIKIEGKVEAEQIKPIDFIAEAMRVEELTADGLALIAPKVMRFDDRVTVNLYGAYSGKRIVHFFPPESGNEWRVIRATADKETTLKLS